MARSSSRCSSTLALAVCILFSSLSQGTEPTPPNTLSDSERLAGWRLLFDGKSTDGWRNYQKEGISDGWVVEDGALVRAGDGAGDIVTTDEFGSFELAIEYKISPEGNSGLMFHVTEDESTPWQSGPEIQVQDNVDGHDPQKAGWLYQLYKPQSPPWSKDEGLDASRPAGDWNQIYLKVTPNEGAVMMNGVRYYTFKKGSDDWDKRVAASKFSKYPNFGKATSGHISLQDHGDRVAYRSIKIRELPADNRVPNPVDGTMPLKVALAFPNLDWADWEPIDDQGKTRELRPIILTAAGDDSNRLFSASQAGLIHVFENNQEATQTEVFLDLRDRVAHWKKNNEEGLLGLAFHPKYKENGQFYVYYSSSKKELTSIISRFTVSKDDPNKADPNSEQVLLTIDQPFWNHNGGSIAFGPDGSLYIGLGDGGAADDPHSNGQNLSTLLGSILRIDVDTKTGDLAYGIPKDNPFVDRKDARPEIYAYGLRNVWRLSFDRKTGDLWAADVGQNLWEEIVIVEKGANYGWSVYESNIPFGDNEKLGPTKPIAPVWEYDHGVGKSITGGYVYRGSRLPELQGMYVYADYVSGQIWALKYDKVQKRVTANLAIPSDKMPVLAFGEDAQGELYFTIGTASGKSIYWFERAK